jgi:alpha-1,2-mannosyltransferase
MELMVVLFTTIVGGALLSILLLPTGLRLLARFAGYHLSRYSQHRRELLYTRVETERKKYASSHKEEQATEDGDWEKVEGFVTGSATNGGSAKEEWKGVVGFFHPFCNAGGGGERVLWAAIRATQHRWPEAVCVVYTGDHDVDKNAILDRVEDRFSIRLHRPNVHFLYLSYRHYVLASTWPRFTLLGQSLGSLLLAYDAFTLLVPDIFIDTMGFAFSVALSSFLFPSVPTGAYVHYPTISTDMLDNLSADGQGVNAGTGEGLKGSLKRSYWQLFAKLYSWTGSNIDVVMTNSSWTQAHITQLWGPWRHSKKRADKDEISVVFPPVAVEELQSQIEISAQSEANRRPHLIYIAQFRPEKNHQLILEAFSKLKSDASFSARFAQRAGNAKNSPRLLLVGSVRNDDDATYVYRLRILARELDVHENTEFILNSKWSKIEELLRTSSVGVNGMWNEHFGIGVVEYQAAGLICVVNDSGGPKLDIVVPIDDGPTGKYPIQKGFLEPRPD